LKEAARALDMELVYGFCAKKMDLDSYIDSKAENLLKK